MTTREEILSVVSLSQGLKATELVVRVPTKDVFKVLEDLIEEGELVEIEYTVPNIPYRLKSFILPKGSVVNGG